MTQTHWSTSLSGHRRTACALLIAFTALGCAEEENAEALNESAPAATSLSERSDALYLGATTWAGGQTLVCFDSADGNNPTLIAEARRQLEASWRRAGLVTFAGWGACNLSRRAGGNFSTVVLHFCGASSTSGNCPTGNYDNSTRTAGAFRGRTFPFQGGRTAPTNHGDGTYTPGATHVSLISDDTQPFLTRFRYEVLHEFGHALGYLHEQDSNLNINASGNRICTDTVTPATTGSSQTPFFDNDSVMNYCARDPLTGSRFLTMLSNGDVMGVRVAYGRDLAFHGFMIKSDRNSGLAVNAWGGAAEGTVLRLHQSCSPGNPDCTWTYQRGMLVSDRDPSLAINAWGGAGEQVTLKLTRLCTPSNPDCTWTYKNGQFLSDKNPALAINAWNGAVHGATLVTTGLCSANNPDCTWTLPDVMLSSNRDPSLAVNAVNGAANHTALALSNLCVPGNPDCTFTFSKGMLISSTNSTLAVNAWNGARNLAVVEVNNFCTATNPDCTWTWKKGQIISDNKTNGTLPINAVGGGVQLAPLKLNSACTETNPDCVFSGLFAKP